MPRGLRFSPDLRRTIYYMSFNASAEDIASLTAISVRTIYRIIQEGRRGEDFIAKPHAKTNSRILSERHIQVSIIIPYCDSY